LKEEANTRIIPINKTKVALFLLLQIIGGFAGYWLYQSGNRFSAYGVGIMGGIIIVFPFFINKLFSKSPGFIISNEGITDNSSMTSHGFIPWSDIEAIGEQQVPLRTCITLILKDPQKHIDSSSSIKAFFWGSTYRTYKVSALITNTVLNCTYEDLLASLRNGLEKSKAGN
jgi:hypothetical protein